MTFEEAVICFEQRIPVLVVGANDKQEHLVGKRYFIYSVGRYLPNRDSKKINYSVALESSGRCIETIDAHYLNTDDTRLEKMKKIKKAEQFNNLIKELLAAGLNQTQILEKVRRIVKDLRKEAR